MKKWLSYFSLGAVAVVMPAFMLMFSPWSHGQDERGVCQKNCTDTYQQCRKAANANQAACKQAFDACRAACRAGNTNSNDNTRGNTNGNTNSTASSRRCKGPDGQWRDAA